MTESPAAPPPDLVEMVHIALTESMEDLRTEQREEEGRLRKSSAHLDFIAIPCGIVIMVILALCHLNGMCEAATFTPATAAAIVRHLGRKV